MGAEAILARAVGVIGAKDTTVVRPVACAVETLSRQALTMPAGPAVRASICEIPIGIVFLNRRHPHLRYGFVLIGMNRTWSMWGGRLEFVLNRKTQIRPPFARIVWPFTHMPSDEHKAAMTFAMSSGSPSR